MRVLYDGGAVTARRVIVALPPTLAGRLHYTPALPAARDALTQQVPMGSVIGPLLHLAPQYSRQRARTASKSAGLARAG